MPNSLEELLSQAYCETHELLKRPELRQVVKRGLLISYGPPIQEPDLLLVSFQGGGKTNSEEWTTWPRRLLYLDSDQKFGKTLRELCKRAGLSTSLESSAMALPAVFPQARDDDASQWKRKTGPYGQWRRHSAEWVTRLTDEIRPRVVMVFGQEASKVLGIEWSKVQRRHRQNHQTFGLSTFRGAPAVYCQHLSRCDKTEALKSFRYAKKFIP